MKESYNWSEYAKCYDALLELEPYVQTLHEVAEAVAARPCNHLLDVGCGTGNFLNVLRSKLTGKNTRMTGIDSSKEMLRRAKQKVQGNKAVGFVEGDLDRPLPFATGSFDVVVSMNSLYAVTDPQITVTELRRVLSKGGYLFLVTPKSGYENGLIVREHCKSTEPEELWLDAHSSPERELLLLLRKAFGNDEETIRQMQLVARYNREIAMTRTFHFFEQSDLTSVLIKSGFVVQAVRPIYAGQDFFFICN